MNADEIKNEIAKLEDEYKLFPSIEKKEKIEKLKSILFFIENEAKKENEEEQKNKHLVRKRR